ncbi:g12586 [Coccomyxa viridis]|uniref:G12586 protein n=1 Tax=Coccomyxa viridis TaxID=1274662 RepID=A0ABP1GAR2_9CHLO
MARGRRVHEALHACDQVLMSNYGATELFVANFFGIQEELQQLFGAHGSLQEFWVSQKKGVKTQAPSQGLYGVVRMATHEEAFVAKKALNNTAVNGKVMSVRWAANVRVLWVGQLGPSVNNAALEAAFAQFGPVAKAVVVSDAHANTSRRFGFVAFERKEDCQRALAMCGKNMFLIGNSARPVVVEMARTEDADEGFPEEEGKSKAEGMAPPLGLPAHFALEGTAEHSIALQLRQAQEQYRQTRQRLKAELQETESALLRGVMPSALALQPPMRVAPVSAPALGNGQVPAPWLTSSAAVEGPERSPPRQRDRRSLSPPRRRHENFHHVAPPKRLRTARDFSDNRYMPRSGETAPPPDVAAAAAAPRSSGGFVRGGTLGTVAQDGSAQPPSPSRQRHGQPPAHTPAAEQDNGAPSLPGAKPLGSHDHGGIGFSMDSPAIPAPPVSSFQPGQGAPPQTSQPASSAYMGGGMQYMPPPQAPPPPQPAPPPSYPPRQGPMPHQGARPQHYPPPGAQGWQGAQQQPAWGGQMPGQGQQYYGGQPPPPGQPMHPPPPQHGTPQYMGTVGRGGGPYGRGRGY